VTTITAAPHLDRQIPPGALWILWRDSTLGGGRQGFAGQLFACPNANCTCTEVVLQGTWVDERLRSVAVVRDRMELTLAASPAPNHQPPSGTRTTIRIDHKTGRVRTNENPSRDESELAALAAQRIDSELLERLVAATTGHALPRPPDDLLADWSPGELVSHLHAFPGIEPLILHDGDHTWLFEDLHCIDPACACTDVRLVIHKLPRGDAGANKAFAGTFVTRLPSLRVTEAEPETDVLPDAASLVAPWQRLSAERPNLAEQLDARRRRMKTLRPPVPSGPAPARRRVAPGRNDPCPCGSGKKWKKCCGN
jgi:hypothetical protein